jgi:Icc-related predicted phosphoesterase
VIIVAVTDLHGTVSGFDSIGSDLTAADLVLLTGDLTHFGRSKDAARVVAAVRARNPRVLAVAGNCDNLEVEDYLRAEGISLHGRNATADGLALVGLGGSLPCPGKTPNELSEGRLRALLEQAAAGLDADLPLVLVSHQPPRDTATDRVYGGAHVGSESVRWFVETHRPLVCFTGHIHEAMGTDCIGETRIVNPGPLRHGGYAYAEIDGGLKTLEIRGRA